MTKLSLTGGKPTPGGGGEEDLRSDLDKEVDVLVKVIWASLCHAQASGAAVSRNAAALAFADCMLKLTAAHAKATGQEAALKEYLGF